MRARFVTLVLLLTACGGGGAGRSVASAPSAPFVFGSCVKRCDDLKPVLMRDFGVQSPQCGTSEQWGATSDAECDCIFTRQFGVLVNGRSCAIR